MLHRPARVLDLTAGSGRARTDVAASVDQLAANRFGGTVARAAPDRDAGTAAVPSFKGALRYKPSRARSLRDATPSFG
jgi:hypothetical protein